MALNITPEQSRFFYEKSDDAICIISATGELLVSNPAAERLLGISSEDKSKIWNAIPYIKGNDDFIQLFIDAVTQKLTSQEDIVDYVDNKGDVHNLHVRVTFYKQEIAVYLIVITDLTKLIKVRSAFARYTTPDIADYVLSTEEGQKIGGATQNVTILMSDLRGFTALSSKLPAQDLITLLNHYFRHMVAVIEKYHGTLIEFLGDGILVIFGAPKYWEDHAALAVKCAIEMENAIADVNKWNNEHGYPDIEMGIAINTGDTVVGNIGSEKTMKYGCIGQSVNIAGRLEGLTIGGQILITENTRKAITEELDIASEDTFLPKGADVLKYYDITGIEDIKLARKSGEFSWADEISEEYELFFLEEKKVNETPHKCIIVRMSEDNKYAQIKPEVALRYRSNIMLKKGDARSYAKVIRQDDEEYIICFTSV